MPIDRQPDRRHIRTPDQRLRVFISSTLGELGPERRAARQAVEQLRLAPVMFELGARPHPPRDLYRAYLEQSEIFVGLYWQRYGWVAPGMDVSGLEDEYRLSHGLPRLVYVKRPAPEIEPRLAQLLADLRDQDSTSYKPFSTAEELHALLLDDLAVLLAERFDAGPHPDDGSPHATGPPPADGLPTPTSTFVGRTAMLAELRALLNAPEPRLVTLTGPGGIGKTTLALEAVRRTGRSPQGVAFVDLSNEREAADVLPSMLRALRLAGRSEEPAYEALVRALRERRMLVVLDNLEHVTSSGADLVRLLERCPSLSMLVTSRESLRVRGEHVLVVPPLTLPTTVAVHQSAEEAREWEAVRLFSQRAAAAAPGFDLTAENVGAVVEICALLDGLPLAIELAAARVRLFGVQALLARLKSSTEILEHGARDLPERQQTLRRTIEWSMRLLTDSERAALLLLSVFSGGSLSDVEQAAGRVAALTDVDVVDILHSLVDKSLVDIEHTADGPRLRMLNTVRGHAAEQREADPAFAAEVRRAHAEQYADLAGRHRATCTEIDNLRTAWSHWTAQDEVERLDDIFEVLWELFVSRGDYRSAMHLGEDLLAVLSRLPSTPERVDAEHAIAMDVARARVAAFGFSPETQQALDAARQDARAATARSPQFPTLRAAASLHMLQSDFAGCAQVTGRMMALAEGRQDPALLFQAHLMSGTASMFVTDVRVALDHVETALSHLALTTADRVQARVGPHQAVVAEAVAGLLSWMNGLPDRACTRLARALADAEQLQHPYTTAFALHHSALLDLWRQDVTGVLATTDRLLSLAHEHDLEIWNALGLIFRGAAKAVSGDPAAGVAESESGFALYRRLSTPPVFWPGLLVIRGATLARAGRVDDALAALDTAEHARAEQELVGAAEGALVRADVLLAQPTPDVSQAHALCARAAELAHQRHARMLELEALTRLTTLDAGTAAAPASAQRLRELVESFTEGASTPQVIAARAALGAPVDT